MQGTLTTAYSTTIFFKDIDTLAELDKSGLPIGKSTYLLRVDFYKNKAVRMKP
jgi:hypothetical protein